jgi:uncharacterized protein (TIGR03083 family)
MARLSRDRLLGHLRTESERFRDVLARCDPAARVPACPGWDASDLLWHLAETQWFWGTTIRNRPAPPPEDRGYPARPDTRSGLLSAFDEYSAAMLHELAAADPAEPAWSWVADQTVGFTLRRQTHEALIHRLDAEQAAGEVTALDPALAADGVHECLDVLYGGAPSWGEFRPIDRHVLVECHDTADRTWVLLGRYVGTDPGDGTLHDDVAIKVVDAPARDPDVVLGGPAAALDAWLWRRGDDAEIKVEGDQEAYEHLTVAVSRPIT